MTHGQRRRIVFRQRSFYVECESVGAVCATTVGITELARRRLVLLTLPNATRIVVEAEFDAIGAKPVVAAEANWRNALLALVAGGADGTVLAWGGSPDPVYRWTLITDPAVFHDVSLCTGRNLQLSELRSRVEQIVEEIVMDTIRQSVWIGRNLCPRPVFENLIGRLKNGITRLFCGPVIGSPDDCSADCRRRRGTLNGDFDTPSAVDDEALVRALYDAFAKGDLPGVLGVLSEDIDWTEAEGLPLCRQLPRS